VRIDTATWLERGDRIARTAVGYVGCSLKTRREELALLVATSPDDSPERVVTIKTNCAMFARGVIAACGVVHPALEAPYRIGYAVVDVLAIAQRYGALREWRAGDALPRGAILHYATRGRSDDHVECCLLAAADDERGWTQPHCGGGRANNAITLVTSDVRRSSGRPLRHWIDPALLLEDL
jgi:hypothetical protein